MRKQPGLQTAVLADTGPLVALLSSRDTHHAWVLEQLATMKPPLITCEAVLAEATHLLRQLPHGRAALLEMVGEGFLTIGMEIGTQSGSLLTMVKRYASVPMSLADACMVRLAELNPHSVLWTLDSDFSVYRKNGRHVIPLVTP
jgi:predicted nucleic acid-binding protein